eukprot:TRINITY_DN10770_c0_g1_i1.p1 TRINITY_DN10770_c0_g1~~TRINITY_DN10770_c0_g1_i1.p1  ORF type:complete len:73 (+),score=4.09 TRINITY_DN10770_c0_g1_i1:92-310(+)
MTVRISTSGSIRYKKNWRVFRPIQKKTRHFTTSATRRKGWKGVCQKLAEQFSEIRLNKTSGLKSNTKGSHGC